MRKVRVTHASSLYFRTNFPSSFNAEPLGQRFNFNMCLRRLNTAGGLAAYIQQVHQPELERCVDFFRLCHRITDTHFL